jgi:NADH-quinone oxidoreductase subunit E
MAHGPLLYPTPQNDAHSYTFSPEEAAEIQRHVAKYPERQSAIMPALWVAQEKWGWLPQKAMQLISETLDVPYAQVYGVATFYTMYLKENNAKHLIEVCTCFTCGVCNGKEVLDAIMQLHNCDENGISADGQFYFREAECLGACDSAPVAQINNRRLMFDVTEQSLETLLGQLSRGEEIPFKSVPLADQKAIAG